MAKIVSTVPKLLTGTLALTAASAKPALPAPVPPVAAAAPPDIAVTPPAAADPASAAIAGPDLADDLSTIETRSRGRLGTIATSFRGVLNDGVGLLPRRTLLGE